ncbi:hypothetical protein E2A64_06335 [Pseudohoeflea suaedae]|uniref:Uncharacterized protein n=1 Tax=Pseudohoeflea suaedae TaxID=877384 RepID=A0A4R5PNS5_9HYPH|nr:hypothetical protein E2A64_06335 [Pseudohoeflea suaedae]
MPGPAFWMIFCSIGSPWANSISTEKIVTSATLRVEISTSENRSGTAPHMPTIIAVSQASPSSGGRPTRFMTGEKTGAIHSITPMREASSAKMVIGTVMRKSIQ